MPRQSLEFFGLLVSGTFDVLVLWGVKPYYLTVSSCSTLKLKTG